MWYFKSKGLKRSTAYKHFPLTRPFNTYLLPLGGLEVQILIFWKVVFDLTHIPEFQVGIGRPSIIIVQKMLFCNQK